MLLNEYLNRFREGIQKIENYGYADSVDLKIAKVENAPGPRRQG